METPGLKSNYGVALKTGFGEWHALSNIKMTGWRFLWKLRHQVNTLSEIINVFERENVQCNMTVLKMIISQFQFVGDPARA